MVNARRTIWLALGALGGLVIGGLGALAWWLGDGLAAERLLAFTIALIGTALLLLLGLTAFGALLEVRLLRPLHTVAQSMRIIQHAHPGHYLELPADHWLGELPEAVLDVGGELYETRRDISRALARGAAQAELEKNRLESVLLELTEGVIVCDPQGHILLYNPAALRVLAKDGTVGLGRSLYDVCARAPIEHALEHLRDRDVDSPGRERDATFISSTVSSGVLIRCRLRLVTLDVHTQPGFVLAFDDVTRQIEALGQRDGLLRRVLNEMRQPLADMHAAAMELASSPSMDAASRADVETTLAEKSAVLRARLDDLSADSRSFAGRDWLMGDVYSADLVRLISKRLPPEAGIAVTMTGIPLWMTADSHSLTLAICHLLQRLCEHTGVSAYDFETSTVNHHVQLALVWKGEPLPQAILDAWSADVLPDAVGALTVKDVIETHGGDLASTGHDRDGFAMLCMPLAASSRASEVAYEPLPARPEFYDFEQPMRSRSLGELADRELNGLDYVVFDTETTGLQPAQGDEIISIGGVRIVNRRILGGETFEQLVNPGRPIPKSSIRFHHITDEMVADAPPLTQVLPRFRQFVGDSVLVAHNSAFDMKFLHLKQAQSGVQFENPVLDTLLISVFLHEDAQDQTLDGIARRLGVEVTARHTALGDALVTAEVLLRLLALVQERGIKTLGALMKASERMVHVRKMQEQF